MLASKKTLNCSNMGVFCFIIRPHSPCHSSYLFYTINVKLSHHSGIVVLRSYFQPQNETETKWVQFIVPHAIILPFASVSSSFQSMLSSALYPFWVYYSKYSSLTFRQQARGHLVTFPHTCGQLATLLCHYFCLILHLQQ